MAQNLPAKRGKRHSSGGGIFFLGLCVLFLSLAACTRDPLKAALKGKFPPTQNNRIINNYCQSCHVHRDFIADRHVAEVAPQYEVREFREARECRVCHSVNFNFFDPEHRITLHPPDGSSS